MSNLSGTNVVPLADNKVESAAVLRKIGELAVGERVLNAIGMQQVQVLRCLLLLPS